MLSIVCITLLQSISHYLPRHIAEFVGKLGSQLHSKLGNQIANFKTQLSTLVRLNFKSLLNSNFTSQLF